MGKKAKRDHTPEQPPLDYDVNWMPLIEAVALLIKRTTSMRLAIPVIEKGMESGKLPNMRYDLTTGERKPPPPGFWEAHCIHYSDEGHVRVYRRDKNDPRRWDLFFPHPEDEPPDHVYFVSRSHFEQLRSAPKQLHADDEELVRMRLVPPGPKPKDDWPRWIARWLILKAAKDDSNELQNVDALVEEARAWLEAKKIFAPKDNKQIRREIADLLMLIRR